MKKIALLALLMVVPVVVPAYAAPAQKPQVHTGQAHLIGPTSAVVSGTVNPRGRATTYRFDYGLDDKYGLSTSQTSAGSGNQPVDVTATIKDLKPGTTYHYRIEATNSAGTAFGADQQFTTMPLLTIAAKPAPPIVYGSSTTFSGQLKSQDNAGQTIELEANPYPFSAYSTVASTTTDSTGHYSFPPQSPTLNTEYRVRTLPPSPVLSRTVRVGVRLRVTRRVSDPTPAAGDLVTFSGFVCPAHLGKEVRLQRRTGTGVWETVKQTQQVAAAASPSCTSRAHYSVGVHVRHDRTFRLVALAGDGDHVRGISRPIAINVH